MDRYHLSLGRNRLNDLPYDRYTIAPRLHLTRVAINSQGYDRGGAYWGLGAPLYCAEGESGDSSIRLFVRGASREAAKITIRKSIPLATFYR